MPLAIDPALVESATIDPAALDRLIETVWPESYRLALTILHDRGLAEDAAQEACATMAHSLTSLKNARTFSAWMYRVVVNRAISIGRRRPVTQPLDANSEREIEFDSAEALDLYNALAVLPIVQRAVILLRYYAGLNSFDIAAALGVPAATVRFHIMLARRALRKALSAPGNTTTSQEVLSNAR